MTKLHRVQILLERAQQKALAAIAKQKGRSISGVIREIVRGQPAERDREARKMDALQAVEKLTRIRKGVEERYGTCARDLLAEVREEGEDAVDW